MPGSRGRGVGKDVHERALGLLAVRARSRRELERRLVQAGFDPLEEVEPELDRLERVGLVDDEAFARAVVEHAFASRREGRRAVEGRLRAAGVAADTREAVLAEADRGDEDRAVELARQRARRLAGLDPARAYQRLAALLLRRGFAPEVARDAARRALELDPAG